MTNNEFWFNKSDTSRFFRINNKKFVPFMKSSLTCMRCGETVRKDTTCWLSQCGRCKTLISFFKPTPIQLAASLCRSGIIFNIGAVGSGKTTISASIFAMMLRTMPNSRLICAAQTMQQLERNAIVELKTFLHPSELKKMKADYWELHNGSVIEFWPSDDPNKLRSANANLIWLVEASSHKMKLFYNQSVTRARNDKGFVYEYDENGEKVLEKTASGQIKPKVLYQMNLILIEANPEKGAWTNKAVYDAHTIIHTQSVKGIPIIKTNTKPLRTFNEVANAIVNVDITAILNSTVDNPFLSADYLTGIRAGCQSEEEYESLIYCDITAVNDLVFKEVVANPNKYFRNVQSLNLFSRDTVFIEGLDPGGSNSNNDPEAYMLGIFDKQSKEIQWLEEHKIAGLTLDESCKRIWDIRFKWGWNKQKHFAFIADNALGKSFKKDNRFSLKTDYEVRLGVSIITCNDKGISNGVRILKQWFENDAIKFNNTMQEMKKEIFGYETFEKANISKSTGEVLYKQSFTEVNNHLLDVLRYVVVILEGMGFRQEEHRINFARNPNFYQEISKPTTINNAYDLRNYLPGGNRDVVVPINVYNKKPLKF